MKICVLPETLFWNINLNFFVFDGTETQPTPAQERERFVAMARGRMGDDADEETKRIMGAT